MTAAKKLEAREAFLEVGRVERVVPVLRVRLGDREISAQRAKSCLVAPDVGDSVLCALHADGCHLLAVLDGAEGAATRLTARGDLQVEATGRLELSGAEGVAVKTRGILTLAADALGVSAERATAVVPEVGLIGKLLRVDAAKVVVVAAELDHVVERMTQRLKRALRFVEGLDQTRAGTVDVRADDLASVRGENTIVSARMLAKVDGEQIHIG
ncbi:MAG: DUF3540 domain-containing protein [Polyangiaceae bacterium]|nr:DUF3540 domain-containing protein [Polyangiaceae bacterium]MBK8936208.1 DUF3540 domain-containing protein [Polyangiaceae bacterium]